MGLSCSQMDSALFCPLPELSKEADSTRPPRVRTAFTAEQVSTLESSFQHQRYLGPLERRRLAQKMQLSEAQVRPLGHAGHIVVGRWPVVPLTLILFTPQIKTWFQNRRMKHKRQLQDSQPNAPLPGALYTPLAFCPPPSALGSGLQLLYPWAPLPRPSVLAQPPGSFWGPCQVEHASVASAWAPSGRQPLLCCLPDPGSQVHTLGPALSRGPWGLCVLPETGNAF